MSALLVADAQPLVHHRARRRVLQELAFGGVEMVLDGEGGERRLVEARQDELLLAGIGVDVATANTPGRLVWNFSVSTLRAFFSSSRFHSAMGPSFGCRPKNASK
jgi:hypothetical protein